MAPCLLEQLAERSSAAWRTLLLRCVQQLAQVAPAADGKQQAASR
jgi:hypothetical protein